MFFGWVGPMALPLKVTAIPAQGVVRIRTHPGLPGVEAVFILH